MERLRLGGFIRRPTKDEIRSLAAMEYMHLTDQDASDLEVLIDNSLSLIDRLDDLPVSPPKIRYKERDSGYRPSPEEDPYNVFIRKCLVKGAPRGKMAGKKVGVKDGMHVAGVPTTCGSRLLAGYIPDIDAVVVERLLDAGATIVGKLNMDDSGMAGTGETSAFGVIRNPRNPEYSAGGSSGGSGAAVAAGEVDIALGIDGGGSGRIPAAWCGVVAMKATHGLVPIFGCVHALDHTTEFVCPTAKTVEEVALTLEVIAGDDPRDPQWVRGPIKVDKYTKALREDVSGIRLGVIKESMDWDVSEEDVNEAVRRAVNKLESMGASTTEVSFPLWKYAWSIWSSIVSQSASVMVESNLQGYGRGGLCDLNWQDAFGKARRAGSDGFPPLLKMLMVLGKYLRREYDSTYYSKAQNQRFNMTRQADRLLEKVDVLVTPTTPMKAIKLLNKRISLREMATRATSMSQNVGATNITGHPSLTIPCGVGENGLPIGLQLIGRRFEESLLFRVAYTLEQNYTE